MAKKPDTPCAGGCGKLLWSGGRGSLPTGQRKCRDCRQAQSTPLHSTPRMCAVCSQEYYSPYSRARYCSLRCAAVAAARQPPAPERYSPRPCVQCGGEVRNRTTVPVCTACSAPRTAERDRSKSRRRRALKRGAEAEKYTLAEIADRDGHRCGLCGGHVDMVIKNPHPWAPTVDHIVPISLGGDDTRGNVWLAHRVCNLRKGNRVELEALTAP